MERTQDKLKNKPRILLPRSSCKKTIFFGSYPLELTLLLIDTMEGSLLRGCFTLKKWVVKEGTGSSHHLVERKGQLILIKRIGGIYYSNQNLVLNVPDTVLSA